MHRRFNWDKQYLHWGVTAFCVIAASIAFYMVFSNLAMINTGLATFISILSPFLWGLVITYLLSPLMQRLEKRVFLPLCGKLMKKSKDGGKRLARGMSVVVSLLVFFLLLLALVYLLIPQLYNSIATIVANSNSYLENLTAWIRKLLENYPSIGSVVTESLGDANEDIMGWVQNNVLPRFGGFVTNITSGVYTVFRGVYNLVIGIIVSAYILGSYETVLAGIRRVTYSLFPLERAESMRSVVHFVDRTFMSFITGKLLDSAIVGIICYIFCAIANMPYALLVSVIVGITNIIPFFGPFIGAIPSAFIILLADPPKALIFVIFIIVLQQVDGNIIGPKILGSSVGINGFWVMFAIIVGAGLFSFWGMLLGVPVFVLIYTGVDGWIGKRLKRKDLPIETGAYMDLERVDPISRRIIRREEDVGDEAEPS